MRRLPKETSQTNQEIEKEMKRLFALTLIISTLFVGNTYCYQVEVQNLPQDKYFETALNELNNAKSSIQVVMYLISVLPDQPNSQPNQLVNALIKAKDRGVEVKVILDQNINFESESTEDAMTSNKNQKAYELLRKNSVPVFFDTSDTYTHTKALIIDNETVILGSSNWSKSALTRNNESNILIRSKELAQDLLNNFNQIKLQENIPASLTPSVLIPKDFIASKKLLGEIATQSDQRTLDTYLYLLKEFNQNKEQKLTLDYDNLAKSLGISRMPTEDYRRQIRKVLDKLKDKYKLITFEPPSRNQNVEIKLLTNNQESVQILTTYWHHNWNQTLPFPAKVMYLINLSYIQSSPNNSFSISREQLSKDHGISESFISEGNQSLRKLNLLDIQYSEIENQSYSQRQPNTYRIQELYNSEDLKERLVNLEQKHGKDKLQRAIQIAAIVFEENNPKTIEILIDLENQYGQGTLEEAARKIKDKNSDNPKRSAGYLINTIKSMAKETENIGFSK